MPEESKKIIRSRRRGFKDIHIALVTKNTLTEYATAPPVSFARGLSAKVSDKFTVEKLYSDDGIEEIIEEYEGTEIELNINTLAPQDRALLKGHLYKHGFLVKGTGDESPEIAIGWRAKKRNGKYEFVWYYLGKFSEGIDDNYETQEDKIKTQTSTLKGTFYARAKEEVIEGKRKNLYAINVDEENLLQEHTTALEAVIKWFEEVAEYKAPTSTVNTEKEDEVIEIIEE